MPKYSHTSMLTMASKEPSSKGRSRASALRGWTASATPLLDRDRDDVGGHPQVDGRDLHPQLPGEEDRRRAAPAAEVEDAGSTGRW